MVTLNINDFDSGYFKIALNQNDIAAFQNYISAESVENSLINFLGIDFVDDYKANPQKYEDIEESFSFQIGKNTKTCKGLKFVVAGDVYLTYSDEVLNINVTDSGRVNTKNEPSVVNINSLPKTYNEVYRQALLIHLYIKENFKDIKINDFKIQQDSFI